MILNQTINVISHIVSAKRVCSKDIENVTSLSRRSAQRILQQLEEAGFVQGDGEVPTSYKITERGLGLFKLDSGNNPMRGEI